MIKIRAGRGLGDSLYLRAIVEHLVADGASVTVLSDWSAVFIGSGARVEPFARDVPGTVVAHYTSTIARQETTQYVDMLRMARLPADIPLRFPWNIQNRLLVDSLTARAAGRPIILVHAGVKAMQRTDGFSNDMLPRREAIETLLGAMDDCYRVGIGKAERLYELPLDEDLHGKTTVSDLLDLGAACDGIVAQCSFCVPLAEVFDKPLLAVWAANGLRSSNDYIRCVRPEKVLSKPSSGYVMDDWPSNAMTAAARAFRTEEWACAL